MVRSDRVSEAKLIGRVAGLEGLAQIAVMALYGPPSSRSAAEVADLVATIAPRLKSEAADRIAAAGLDGGLTQVAQQSADAVIDGALGQVTQSLDLVEKVRLRDIPTPERAN